MSWNRRPSSPQLIFALLLAAPLAWGEVQPPDPQKLLDDSLAPEVSFKGRMMVTHWFGKQTTAEEIEVYHAPPNLYRREYFSPDGGLQRIQLSDGEVEQNLNVKRRKVVSGDAVKTYEKVMKPEHEMELLLKNYELSVSTKTDEVAGRKAWVLDLKPRVAGKPLQKLWIDQQYGVILENKRFLPKMRYAVLSRYSSIAIVPQLDPKLFALDLSSSAPPGSSPGLDPDFMTLDELGKATGRKIGFPAELPEGFAFESSDYFSWGAETVLHARYTDGLAVLSLFQTDKPVSLPKSGTATVAPPPTKGGGSIRLAAVGRVLNWRRGAQYYTLMGDVSAELLQSISAGLK